MEILIKLRILEKSNELIKSIARLMLRPLGSNIEFGCNPKSSYRHAGHSPKLNHFFCEEMIM